MSKTNKENGTQMPKIENIFKERLLNQKKLLKIKLKTIDFSSNYNTTTTLSNVNNIYNKSLRILENNKYEYKNIKRIKKIKSKTDKNLFSTIDNKSKKKYIINYNNFDFIKNLKKYTNNSLSYRAFNELNNPYHPYSVDKVKRSPLIQINNNKEKEKQKTIHSKIKAFNSIKSLLYNNNDLKLNQYFNVTRNMLFMNGESSTFRNEIEDSKIFKSIGKVNISRFINQEKYKNMEILDTVDINQFENAKLQKAIRISLVTDINLNPLYNKLYSNFLKSITNRVNFHDDIYIVPHISNNFSLMKPTSNFDLINDRFKNRNLLHIQVAFSINRGHIMKNLLIKQREMDRKRMQKEEEYNPKKKWNFEEDYYKIKISEYEQQFEQFELSDFFGKCTNYAYTSFADKRLNNLICSKKFSNNN